MGIGLAVSRSIMEAHDGGLSAENNADFGAKFTVTIPLPKSADSAHNAHGGSEQN